MPPKDMSVIDTHGLRLALLEAQNGYSEGGFPVGAVLLIPDENEAEGYKVLGSGHNERVQKGSVILHAETSALENAGILTLDVYRKCILYTTLSPCPMCSGAILLHEIPRVVVGENESSLGEEQLLKSRGVKVVVVNDESCKELMRRFAKENPELHWI
ncbi:cytidine deaminase-like protein [Crassisporium funariophilum]|nr:cytidine deaminase-like protein [Crassisporium funariophilum]